MRFSKIIAFGFVFSFLTSFVAQAEVVKCSVTDEDFFITTTVTIEPKHLPHGGLEKHLFAEVANDTEAEGEKLKDKFMVKRTRTANELRYQDMTSGSLFKLILKDSGFVEGGLVVSGALTLYEGFSYQRKFEDLSCTIEGKPYPAEPACPEPKDLKNEFFKAVRQGSAQSIHQLLLCGAQINAEDEKGCTAFLYASDHACGTGGFGGPRGSLVLEEVLRVLLENGAEVENRDPLTLRTPLLNFARYRSPMGIDILLELKANINAQDKDGNTALIFATDNADELMIRKLLGADANKEIKNKKGFTAYSLAEKKGYTHLLELLEPAAAKAVIEAGEDGKCSPTMVHIYKGKPVEVILKANKKDMFLLVAPDLKLELMAMPGESDKKIIKPEKTGTFPFKCGVHGGPEEKQTKGSFMVM